MSSSLLLKGTPAQIDPSLIPGGVVTDTINGLVGDITIAGGAGISIPAPVGQVITVNLDPSTAAPTEVLRTDNTGAITAQSIFNVPANGAGLYIMRTLVFSQSGGGGYAWVNGTNQFYVDVTVTPPAGGPYVESNGSVAINSLVSEATGSELCITNIFYLNANSAVAVNGAVVGAAINIGPDAAQGYIQVTLAPLFSA